MKSCPFCGAEPRYSANEPKMLGCVAEGCPIRMVLFTPDDWEMRYYGAHGGVGNDFRVFDDDWPYPLNYVDDWCGDWGAK